MVLDLLAIISAAGTGAVTGYLTNNLALKMIFKEYGPLGGVVIKTKDEFIDSISALVERDLVNHHTLEEEFSRPEFKQNFNQSLDDFLNIYLEQRTGDFKLGELPGWKENFELLSSAAAETGVEFLAAGSRELKEQELSQLISESGQQKLLQEVFSKVIIKAEAAESGENLILRFYEQLKSKSLTELLNKESQSQLKKLVKESAQYFRDNYQDLDKPGKEAFKAEISQLFNLEKISQNILNELKELKLSDLIKDSSELEEILSRVDLHDLVKEILVNLKIELDNSQLLIEDFFTEELEADLKQELSELISTAESDLLDSLESAETELNDLILEAVEEEIEASTGFKAMSRQGIYNKYQEKIEEYGLPVTHLKNYLEAELNSDNQKLAAELTAKIKEIKIAKLLPKIELEKIIKNLEKSLAGFYQQYEDQKIIELFSEEIFAEEMLTDKIVELIFSSLEKISGDADSIEILIDYLMELKLEDLLSREKLVLKKDKIAAEVYRLLSDQDLLTAETAAYLNQNFFNLLNKELDNSRPQFKKGIASYLNQQQGELAAKEIKSFYTLFQDDPEAVADLTESITAFFYNNLPQLLEGKVAEAASANLHQLSDQEVQAAIEDFMGQELKPITYLGALLGAAAGIIFSLSGAETAIFNASPVWVDYLSSAILYGGVGWLTNVLAIWMIFHPYQQKNILGARIPFTPGVVAKNRSRFADSMGKFVEKELLKANSAAEIIENNRSEIKARTLEYFKDSDYQQLFEQLRDKNEILAEFLFNKVDQLLSELEADDFKALIDTLEPQLDTLLTQKLASFDFGAAATKYLSQEENSLPELETRIVSGFQMEQLAAFVNGEYKINLNSSQLKQLLKNKELYPFFKFLAPQLLEKEFEFDLKNYLLKLLQQDSDYYLDQSLNLFFEQQENIARLINFKKDEIIENEKEKEGGMLKNTLISGAIYMADLDQFVDSIVERVFNKLQNEYFVEHRDQLEGFYYNLLDKLQSRDLLTGENLKLNRILKNFVSTKQGSELLTEVLYLSDQPLARLIDLIFKEEKQQLLSLNIELKAEAAAEFIKQQLNLEQKLKLLLLVKDLFTAENMKKEILQLLQTVDLKIINQELKSLLQEIQLIDPDLFDAELLAELKTNLASLLKSEEVNRLLLNKSEEEITKLAETLEQEMDREGLEYLLALFVEAGVDSFKANSEALLKSLELKELTAAEVRKMNPVEIEEVFDSFAGKYFAHLKQYGWFGGIFGVLQLLLRNII
ncbi:uncharacterized membrane protein YheB (UPF0754 family) [Halanaerobium saccharolyticum]|uniref:Uncharacterized membrane protein YheB (UPF0754 family) n=1 Tax=Halanaerobium saccharolyticum TaxID=43595 RepID=A0A4V3G612_9FIRM|nr:DUF445 family protein [Halanaerobium saccharolyticum]RAK11828.1 uncharacterized membrane protein YheB (UPF0754 family) [Halanaerobium saccharolyticum]TDW07669.1 uncharacterized membrane protein YheB (UPF0754 family) [Halanaerobium saccharolyticum]TDX64590.1 uncharacterized membrane protein YheB (UPF0754 family) [Halanaerobium saccharolyticum]